MNSGFDMYQNSGYVNKRNRKISLLDYLIIGEKPTVKKVKMADELKIKILSQDDWKKMLD